MVEPRPKFSFKTRKNASAISLADAAELAVHQRPMPGYLSSETPSTESSLNATPTDPSTPLDETDRQSQQKPEVAPTSFPVGSLGAALGANNQKAKGSFPPQTTTSSVSVDKHHRLHIMLPSTTSNVAVPASITSLRHCVVDMSIPTANGKPHANLTISDVKDSLLVCGQISGPAHITSVRNSVIVVSCWQFRMHNCESVDVYLSCSSNPIIEDCSNIRFGRIPKSYVCLAIGFPFESGELILFLCRAWTRIWLMRRTVGARWMISNGSSQGRVRIGVSWIQPLRFRKRCGLKLFLAGQDGRWMIFYGLSRLSRNEQVH